MKLNNNNFSGRRTISLSKNENFDSLHKWTGQKSLISSELVLIRGLPGSGKSTMAKTLSLVGYQHFEADMAMYEGDCYVYDPSKVRAAHQWCKEQARDALEKGQKVVIANTFTRIEEMRDYLQLSSNIRIIETHQRWDNIHGVPEARIQSMIERWEQLPQDLAKFRTH